MWWRIVTILSRGSVLLSLQFVLLRPLKARPLIVVVFRAFTSCPTIGLFFWTAVQSNNTGYILKGMQIDVSGFNSGFMVVETRLFQHPPHMLDNTNTNQAPILWWRSITILEEDPATYPHTCLGPVIHKKLSLLIGPSSDFLGGESVSLLQLSYSRSTFSRYTCCNVVITKIFRKKLKETKFCYLHCHGQVS